MTSSIQFPFWMVARRHADGPRAVELDGAPGHAIAFTTAENATRYMVDRGETAWENRLVARSTLRSLLEELRRAGLLGICLDPTADHCGSLIGLGELERCVIA